MNPNDCKITKKEKKLGGILNWFKKKNGTHAQAHAKDDVFPRGGGGGMSASKPTVAGWLGGAGSREGGWIGKPVLYEREGETCTERKKKSWQEEWRGDPVLYAREGETWTERKKKSWQEEWLGNPQKFF
jgi:hypothetical protein